MWPRHLMYCWHCPFYFLMPVLSSEVWFKFLIWWNMPSWSDLLITIITTITWSQMFAYVYVGKTSYLLSENAMMQLRENVMIQLQKQCIKHICEKQRPCRTSVRVRSLVQLNPDLIFPTYHLASRVICSYAQIWLCHSDSGVNASKVEKLLASCGNATGNHNYIEEKCMIGLRFG